MHTRTMFRTISVAIIAALALVTLPSPAAAHDGPEPHRGGHDAHGWHSHRTPQVPGLVISRSERSFDDTWDVLINALEANPNITIISTVDHAAAAASAGLDLDPNRVVIFGNPALGSPVMAVNRTAGLDLPQKMQVWEQRGKVYVGYNSTDYLVARHDVGDAPTLDTIAGALANFAAIATGTDVDAPRVDHHHDRVGRTLRWVEQRPGVETSASDADFDTTWDRLVTAIEASPASVAFTVDHGANSGGTLAPTRLVVFGNPNLGTPLMQHSATAGIDLPLKILVWEDADGVTQVSTNDVRFLRRRHRLDRVRDSLAAIEGALTNFVAAATTTP